MRAALTVIFCATLPLVAGFAFSGASRAQDMQQYGGMQYEGPGVVSGMPASVMPVSGMQQAPIGEMTRAAQMEQQIRELTNQLEQRDFQIRQLQQNFDRFVNDTNARLQALESRYSGTITGTENLAQSGDGAYAAPAGTTATAASESTPVTGTVDDPNAPFRPSTTPQLGQLNEAAPANTGGAITSGRPQGAAPAANAAQAYDQAFAYLQQSNYQDAQRAFSEFLKTYPSHPLAANAQFWLGETYFAQTQYSVAAKTFAKAFQDHPQGQKAPDALLKLALTLEKMNKKEDACLTLGELTKRFPSGPASVLRRGDEERQRMGCQA